MRLATRSRPARRGVILIVVLTMLALLALVGVTFSLFADAARPGNRIFRPAVEDLGRDTASFAFNLLPALAEIDDQPVDVRSALADLDRLSARASDLKARVAAARDRESDPATRADLQALARRLAEFSDLLALLSEWIDDLP